MAKDTFYFSHDFNSRHDPKLVTVQMEYQMEGIGIYWCLVEMLHEQGGYVRMEYERIAFELRSDSGKVKWIIEQSGLFEIEGNLFYSKSALERINKRESKSVKASESANKRWGNANALPTQCEGNAIKERKGKERKGKKDINNKTWRDDFNIYLNEFYLEYEKLINDSRFIDEQQYFRPNVDIKKTMLKVYTDYWTQEKCWKHKKATKTEIIDWRATVKNALDQPYNKVYLSKDEQIVVQQNIERAIREQNKQRAAI